MNIINPENVNGLYSCSILKGKLIEATTQFRSVAKKNGKMYFVNTTAFSKVLKDLPWFVTIIK